MAAAQAAFGTVKELQPGHTYYGEDNTTGIHWAAAIVERVSGKDVVYTPTVFEMKPGGPWTAGSSPVSPGSLHCETLPANVVEIWGLDDANCSSLAPDEKPTPLAPPAHPAHAPPHAPPGKP